MKSNTQKKKMQHYVPRFYLRKFANKIGNAYKINCFDKKIGKKFPVSIENIAGEQYFYDVEGRQTVEDAFSDLETKVSANFETTIVKDDASLLSDGEKVSLAVFIATQHMRTRNFRNVVINSAKYVTRLAQSSNMYQQDIGAAFVAQLTQEEMAKRYQYTLMDNALTEFSKSLLKMKWTILVNKTNVPFWCSDSPLAQCNMLPYDEFDDLGFERPGSILFFPLSSDKCLRMSEPKSFLNVPTQVYIDDEEAVLFVNSLQLQSSATYLYSSSIDFSHAEKVIQDNPQLKETVVDRLMKE